MKQLRLFALCMLLVTTIALVGCDSPDKVHLGDSVDITYRASFTDGTVFADSGAHFVVGSGQIIPGIDKGVLGMKVGQSKTLTLAPAAAYGSLYTNSNIQRISKLIFDKMSIPVKNGKMQKLGDISGIIKGTEQDPNGGTLVLFDINPRETWDTLIFKVTIVSKS